MRLAGLALFLSFLGFLLFLSGETISGLSTQHTYFARFRDTWDYMLTVDTSSEKEREDTDSLLTALRELPGIESVISYRLVDTKISVPEQMLGEKLRKEGPETLLGDAKQVQLSGQTAWQVDAHFYILDDQSFQKSLCIPEHFFGYRSRRRQSSLGLTKTATIKTAGTFRF